MFFIVSFYGVVAFVLVKLVKLGFRLVYKGQKLVCKLLGKTVPDNRFTRKQKERELKKAMKIVDRCPEARTMILQGITFEDLYSKKVEA